MENRCLARGALLLFLGIVCFLLFWMDMKEVLGETIGFRLLVISLAFASGAGVTALYYRRLDWEEKRLLSSFLVPLVEVLWAVAEHEDSKHYEAFPKARLRQMLLNTNEKNFYDSVDATLVSLAFEVKVLEPTRVKTDPELNRKRDRFRAVHANAVELCLAETSPQTYFDRAVPASQAVQTKTPETIAVS